MRFGLMVTVVAVIFSEAAFSQEIPTTFEEPVSWWRVEIPRPEADPGKGSRLIRSREEAVQLWAKDPSLWPEILDRFDFENYCLIVQVGVGTGDSDEDIESVMIGSDGMTVRVLLKPGITASVMPCHWAIAVPTFRGACRIVVHTGDIDEMRGQRDCPNKGEHTRSASFRCTDCGRQTSPAGLCRGCAQDRAICGVCFKRVEYGDSRPWCRPFVIPEGSQPDFSSLIPKRDGDEPREVSFNGVIRDETSWRKVWSGQAPKVDFAKYMVVYAGAHAKLCGDAFGRCRIIQLEKGGDRIRVEVRIDSGRGITEGGTSLAYTWVLIEQSDLPVEFE